MHIAIEKLRKTYDGGVTALDDVTLDISDGMFGLLGPNGAGKTTMMKIMATLLEPTAGTVRVGSLDVRENRQEIRQMLGYLSQQFSAYRRARVREFVNYIATLNGLKGKDRDASVAKAIEAVGLQNVQDRKVRQLSGGMVRRLGVAQALVGKPKLLIVDEPTVGLDPEERIRFRNLLQELAGGTTVILSTHIVADVSGTCKSLAVLDKGRILFHGSPQGLLQEAEGKTFEVEIDGGRLDDVKKSFSIVATAGSAEKMKLRIVGNPTDGFPLKPVHPTLEDAYIYFMDRKGSGSHREE